MRITEYYLIPFASEIVSQHNITCDPLVVQFNGRQVLPKLRVDLKPVNTPTCDGLDYIVVAYCKEGFSDGRNIRKSTLRSGTECKPTVEFEHSVTKDLDKCYIAYCLYDQTKQSCELDKDKLYNVIILQLTAVETDSDCIANKCELTLDVENYCKKSVPSTRQVQEYKDTPKLSIDDTGSGDFESRVVITCSAAGHKFDLLSLYQKRTKEKKVLLKIVQYLKDEEGEIKLTLHKRVSKNDTGSTIHCVKRKPDEPSYRRKSNEETLRVGDHKYVNYQPIIKVTRITVEPDTATAEFSRDKPLSLVCRGTALIPDRSLTWYIRDENTSELKVPDASQKDQATNETRLTLLLNDSYDSKTLFCAHDSHLVVEHASGRRSVVRYGEAATSRNITLKLQEKTDVAPTGSGPDLGLVCGVVAGIAGLLVATAFVAWWLRRRAAGEGGAPEENQYATIAEVKYAELVLKESAGPPNPQDSSPYAQIVGVYNPRQ